MNPLNCCYHFFSWQALLERLWVAHQPSVCFTASFLQGYPFNADLAWCMLPVPLSATPVENTCPPGGRSNLIVSWSEFCNTGSQGLLLEHSQVQLSP